MWASDADQLAAGRAELDTYRAEVARLAEVLGFAAPHAHPANVVDAAVGIIVKLVEAVDVVHDLGGRTTARTAQPTTLLGAQLSEHSGRRTT